MSQSVLTSTFLSVAKPRLREFPCPRIPMLATTTRSFAPMMRWPAAARRWREGRRTPRHRDSCCGHSEPGREIAARDAVLIVRVAGHGYLLLYRQGGHDQQKARKDLPPHHTPRSCLGAKRFGRRVCLPRPRASLRSWQGLVRHRDLVEDLEVRAHI